MSIGALLLLLPSVLDTIGTLSKFFNKSMDTLNQSKELTPEQEKVRDDLNDQRQSMSHWQQD